MHFNANLNRAIQTRGADSVERIGEATIRDVKIKPDFGKPKTINNNVFIFFFVACHGVHTVYFTVPNLFRLCGRHISNVFKCQQRRTCQCSNRIEGQNPTTNERDGGKAVESGSTEKKGSQEQDGCAKCPSNHARYCVI